MLVLMCIDDGEVEGEEGCLDFRPTRDVRLIVESRPEHGDRWITKQKQLEMTNPC